MLTSLLLSLREGLEAALVIGIVQSTLQKTNREDYLPNLWQGVMAAIAVSLAIGIGLNLLGAEFDGKGEMVFEGTSMLMAAILLTWMIFWMGRQARRHQLSLETGIRRAVSEASHKAVFGLAFIAVLREGTELAFFIFATQIGAGALGTFAGIGLGLLAAGFAGWILFLSTRKLNLRRFFQVSNLLLMFVAAGLVSHGSREFIEAGWLPSGIAHLWDLNPILNEQSFLGQISSALFGYSGNPSLTEVIFYLAYFLALGLVFLFTLSPKKRSTPNAA